MRNRMRLGLLVLGITASATILNAPPAYAQMPVTDAGSYTILGTVQAAITGAIQTMMNNVVSKITGLQTSIQTVLTQGFTQEANYAKAQIGAQQQIADASNMANAQFQRNIRNAQVRDQHILSPQACIALDSRPEHDRGIGAGRQSECRDRAGHGRADPGQTWHAGMGRPGQGDGGGHAAPPRALLR